MRLLKITSFKKAPHIHIRQGESVGKYSSERQTELKETKLYQKWRALFEESAFSMSEGNWIIETNRTTSSWGHNKCKVVGPTSEEKFPLKRSCFDNITFEMNKSDVKQAKKQKYN